MNIDERREKLAERHEALMRTVELLTRDVRKMQIFGNGLQGFVNDIVESTARLLHIAQIHEPRITRLEDQGREP